MSEVHTIEVLNMNTSLLRVAIEVLYMHSSYLRMVSEVLYTTFDILSFDRAQAEVVIEVLYTNI